MGDFREASLTLQEARLDNFTLIHYDSAQSGKSFTLPPSAEFFSTPTWWKSLTTERVVVPLTANLSSNGPDRLMFEFSRFNLIPYGLAVWLILNLVSIPQTRFMKRRLIEQFNRDLEIEKDLARGELAKQIRHNLRSPLAALTKIPIHFPESSAKDRDLLDSIIKQIRELISTLDDKSDVSLSDLENTDLYETLLQAKRQLAICIPKSIAFQFEIDDMICSAQVRHTPFEMLAILGNTVTNAIEAIDETGRISIKVYDLGAECEITISDTGCGIPSAHLNKVFEKRFSYGKTDGTGLGLYHAKNQIESFGGTIEAQSTEGLGTSIVIRLPVHDRAPWYVPRLKFNSNSKIFVLDDQLPALNLWQSRLAEAGLSSQALLAPTFSQLEEPALADKTDPSDRTYLFDFDLGGGIDGLSLLKQLPAQSTRCLVTGHFDDRALREACASSDIRLIPKSQIADIPIIVV